LAPQGTRRIPVTSLSGHHRTEEHPLNGLYALKPWYTRRLTVLVDAAVSRETSPDVFTGLGVLAALLAALSTWRGWWLVAGVLLAARLAGANLDGAVARARGVSRPWGFVLNEIGDRTSDLLMYAGWPPSLRGSPGAGRPRRWRGCFSPLPPPSCRPSRPSPAQRPAPPGATVGRSGRRSGVH